MSRAGFGALVAAAALLAASQGCAPAEGAAVDAARADSIARAKQDSINRAQPGYVIDSVLPLDEELRRFRAAVGGSELTALRHASPSRDALARRAVAALSKADTADLRAMVLDAREFVDLVFLTSPFSRPPYRQPVGFAWQQIDGGRAVAVRRLLRKMAGRSWRYVDHTCAPNAERQGANTIWSGCEVRLVTATGDTARVSLFGSIIEREGHFKLLAFR